MTPSTLLKRNTFIIWDEGLVEDFELVLKYKISEKGNSGVNYRSAELDTLPYALKGYQADIALALRGQRVTLPPTEGSHRQNISQNKWLPARETRSLGTADSLAQFISSDWNCPTSLFIIHTGIPQCAIIPPPANKKYLPAILAYLRR